VHVWRTERGTTIHPHPESEALSTYAIGTVSTIFALAPVGSLAAT
jgi:hypothetical protein